MTSPDLEPDNPTERDRGSSHTKVQPQVPPPPTIVPYEDAPPRANNAGTTPLWKMVAAAVIAGLILLFATAYLRKYAFPSIGLSGEILFSLLIVSILVAIALSLSVNLRRSKRSMPQPCKDARTEKAGENECSVCHQTFPTLDEVIGHKKAAHNLES